MAGDSILAGGIAEFVFGVDRTERNEMLELWAALGFVAIEESELFRVADAEQLYGHKSDLSSVLLSHPGCASFGTGAVRLHFWSELKNEGLADALPLEVGSRWMGMYTHDILQIRDSFESLIATTGDAIHMSPLINASLVQPAPEINLQKPFVGLRETLIFGDAYRLAFIQRAGFDRPGFGTFDDQLPFKNTEGSHANIVQPMNSFSTRFYKDVFGFETAPFGEAHDSGEDEATIRALRLRQGQTFHIERLLAPGCPSGLLQVYSPYSDALDCRHLAEPGSRGLSHYVLAVTDIKECLTRLECLEGVAHSGIMSDEFGRPAIRFAAPDGIVWLARQSA